MSFISKLFGGDSAGSGKDLERRISDLEAAAQATDAGHRGMSLNRAGDLALQADQSERAIALYGRAIDAYLADQHLDAARGVANKIVRVHPDAVRTLCTLTWLDLAARHMATALLHLRDYVDAAKRSNHEDLAVRQIHRMAQLAPFREFLGAAADALDQLNRPSIADEVREWSTGEESPHVLHDEQALAEVCMRSATKISATLPR